MAPTAFEVEEPLKTTTTKHKIQTGATSAPERRHRRDV
jgi:hypothetical protein